MKKQLIYSVLFTLFASISFAQSKEVAYKDGEQLLTGVSISPKKALKNNPGILILPAWMGIDEHSKDNAAKLAELGYKTFVADIYGVDKRPVNNSEAAQKAGFYKKNIPEYHKRIQLALEQLVKQGANPNKIVVIGYCFGGLGAVEAARINMNVKGVISFHGGLARDEKRPINTIIPKILVLHGADDPYESETEIRDFQSEMKTAKADWQMNYYANAVHAFTDKNAGTDNSKGAAYNESADKRSWQAMLSFLKEVL
ncbi:MAG: dienelactone hydrolase family protein [Flavobacterium sp.]